MSHSTTRWSWKGKGPDPRPRPPGDLSGTRVQVGLGIDQIGSAGYSTGMKTLGLFLLAVLVAASIPVYAADAESSSVVEWSGGPIRPGGIFTILTYSAPRDLRLADTGLREAGLAAGLMIRNADEIRIFASRTVMNESPLARVWLNAGKTGAYWFQTGGEGKADDFVIPKGAAVVVWTRVSTNAITWSNVFE